MIKLLKFLKKSRLAIAMIILLLMGQAFCDLSLPAYISNIVNIGLQQNGIANAVPEAIRPQQVQTLLLLMEEKDRDLVQSSYKLLDPQILSAQELETYSKDYPLLKEQPLYLLNSINEENKTELNNIFSKSIILYSVLSGESELMQSLRDQLSAQMQIEPGIDMMAMISTMPAENRYQMIAAVNQQFATIPDTMLTQSSVSYISSEYQTIGINTNQMRLHYILITGLKMLILALLSMTATIFVVLLAARISARLGQDLRGNIFRKVVSFSNAEMDKFSTASLITRSTNDIQQIQMTMVMVLRLVFYAPIIGIGAFIKTMSTTPSMGWIIGIAVAALLTVMIVAFIVLFPKFKSMQKLIDKINMVSREILTGLSVIRAFSTQRYEEKRFDKANRDLTKVNLFVNRSMSLMMPIIFFIMNGISILIVWQGGLRVEAGVVQVGDMMAFIQYTMMIIIAFLMISMVAIMLPRASVAASRIDEVLVSETSITDSAKPLSFDPAQKGLVVFDNVSFRYPNAEKDVLSNISFVARPGQTTAFIGTTGSGKSTIINLIPRFFDVTDGRILVDGVDIRNVSQHDLREKIGYISQKNILFSGDIESNIKYNNDNIPYEIMEKAARIAQAYDFIAEKPDGFHTDISQGGSNISGGQKQRIAIARAIAKQPEIYIFDDSFSALDYKTDYALRKALKEETADSTVLIVAQRISTIMNADQIIVLDEGKIVAKGRHGELLQNCEVYQQLAYSQLSEVELA